MKKLLLAAVCTAALTTGASAATVNLDFVALAAGTPGDRGGVEGQTFDFGGLDVTITSSHDAYLDDLSSGKPAGLGVCSTGIVNNGNQLNQCSDSGDDNVTFGESVTLTFSQGILGLSNFVFNDADHNDISNSTSTLLWAITDMVGANNSFSSFGNLEANIAFSQSGLITSLTLEFDNGFQSAAEFYLGSIDVEFSPVPLPAALPLLLAGLGGLGLMRRRRKAA